MQRMKESFNSGIHFQNEIILHMYPVFFTRSFNHRCARHTRKRQNPYHILTSSTQPLKISESRSGFELVYCGAIR